MRLLQLGVVLAAYFLYDIEYKPERREVKIPCKIIAAENHLGKIIFGESN